MPVCHSRVDRGMSGGAGGSRYARRYGWYEQPCAPSWHRRARQGSLLVELIAAWWSAICRAQDTHTTRAPSTSQGTSGRRPPPAAVPRVAVSGPMPTPPPLLGAVRGFPPGNIRLDAVPVSVPATKWSKLQFQFFMSRKCFEAVPRGKTV